MSADLGFSALSGSLFSHAIRDAREAFAPQTAAVFDLESRVEIVKASRDLTETTTRFDADLDPFIERIRLIDAPLAPVIDMRAAKDALLAKVVGLRVVPSVLEIEPVSCGGKGPAVSGCSCAFCVRYFTLAEAQA